MARLRSRMLQPPHGWTFVENGITLTSLAFEETVTLIRRHRASNGYPAGNPEQELNDFTCHRAPHLCDFASGESPRPTAPSLPDQASTFMRTYAAWASDGFPLVDQVVANQRADTCWKCKFNQQVEVDVAKPGCCGRGAVMKVLQKFASGVAEAATSPALKNHSTPADAELYQCALCGCSNRASAWIPQKYFSYDATMLKKFSSETGGVCWKGNRNL